MSIDDILATERLDKIKLLVDLTKTKVDILKLKADDYTWSCHVDKNTKEILEKTLIEINEILELLTT